MSDDEKKKSEAAARLEERQSINDAIKEGKELQESINNSMAERNALMGEYAKNVAAALKQEIAQQERLLQIAQQTNKGHEERKKEMLEALGLQDEFNQALEQALKAQREGIPLQEDQKKAIKDFHEELKNATGILSTKYTAAIAEAAMKFDGSAESARELAEAVEAASQAGENLQEAQNEVSKVAGQVAGKFGLVSDVSGTLVGQMSSVAFSLTRAFDAAGVNGLAGAMGSFVLESFSAEKILASMVQEALKLAVELDKAGKSFGSATGFNIDAASATIQGVSKDLVAQGVTIASVGTTLQGLASNYSGFDPNNINQDMVKTAATLEKVGVQTAAFGKSLDFMVKVMNKSESQSANMTKKIAQMGRTIGVSAKDMVDNFNNSAKELVEFGSQMMKVFEGLTVQSKLTGMSMSRLVSIAEKFDTFEGASTQIAEMNAVLGTQMSAMDMLNMTHEQRIATIRNEVKASVGNFESLDRYTKKYIAQAMGLENVEEAQRMLNMTNAEANKKQQELLQTQQDLEEITKDLVPMFDQLKLEFMKLVRELDPLIRFFIEFIGTMAKLAQDGWLKWIAIGIAGITLVLIGFGAAGGYAGAQIKLLQIAFMLLIAALKYLVEGQYGTFGMLVGGVVLLGLAFLFLQKRMGKVTEGFSFLKLLFGSKINPLFIQSFAFMAIGVLALALAFKIMGIQGTVAAYALAAVFAGMALVFFSLSFLVESISTLFLAMADSAYLLPVVAEGILSIALAVGALGLAIILSTSAIMFLLTSMTLLGGFFATAGMFLGVNALDAVGQSIERIGNGMDKFASGLSKVKEAAMSMKGITDKAFMAFTTDGSKTSAIITSSDIVKNMVLGKMTVDVKIPEIEIPQVTVNIYMDGSLISNSLYETILD